MSARPQKKLAKDQEAKLVADYEAGIGVPELSKKYRIPNWAAVKNILSRYRAKAPAPDAMPAPEPEEKTGVGIMVELEICAAHIFGTGVQALTRQFNLKKMAVIEILARNEIGIRGD